MDTHKVYEEIMLGYYFNEIKHLRNKWKDNEEERFRGVESLIDISDNDYRQLEFIMRRSSEIIFEMLARVIRGLIGEYKIPVKYYDLRRNEAHAYYVGKEENWIEYTKMGQSQERRILAFSWKDKPEILFIFKEFGISDRVPEKTLEELRKAAKFKQHLYVSYTEKDAYTEVINHNNNENDPTRGTGIISFRQFIEGVFGKEEYSRFRYYADRFSEKAKDYFGVSLVRTLTPNAIHNFKKQLRDNLELINAAEIGASTGISEQQRKLIEKQFLGDKNYEILLGSSDFAQSYMTAEWLYSSLAKAGCIDMTAIAMGYFKAIEQLLFAFIKNHTKEADGDSREVFVGKNKPYADIKGNVLLTDAIVNDPEKTKDLTLGSLTGFFGFHNTDKNYYRKRNQDLLVSGISDTTYEFILDTLGGIVGLRNGYFHKDNLKGDDPVDRKKIEESRNKAHLVFYLMLGAFNYSEEDKTRMGLIRIKEHDDFYKLCNYLNNKAYESFFLDIPVLYINDISDPYNFAYFHSDDYIEFDNYGEPIYSGAYFRAPAQNRTYKIDREHLPNEIWEGVFRIKESLPLDYELTGPKKKIFCEGKFYADENK